MNAPEDRLCAVRFARYGSLIKSTDCSLAENLIADPWAMSAVPDFIYPDTTGVRPNNLEELLNFQHGLGQLAGRDAAVLELLIDVRNLLKPLDVLDDPSLVRRVENEVAVEPVAYKCRAGSLVY